MEINPAELTQVLLGQTIYLSGSKSNTFKMSKYREGIAPKKTTSDSLSELRILSATNLKQVCKRK